MTSLVTSGQSPLRVDWLDTYYIPLVMHAGGRLGMTLLPGKRSPGAGHHKRDLSEDLARLRDEHGCDVLAVLAGTTELGQLGVPNLASVAAANGIDALRFSIRDGANPANADSFRDWLDTLIVKLLAGDTVAVTSRRGIGRAGLVVACLVRDLGDYGADAAIELTRFARSRAIDSPRQQAFVGEWVSPRRTAVASALRRRARQRANEEAAWYATLNPQQVAFERLRQGLRDLLWGADVAAAYLVEPPFSRPARIVCNLIEPKDPAGLADAVRSCAARYVDVHDFAAIIGPVDPTITALYRLVPAPPRRLGE